MKLKLSPVLAAASVIAAVALSAGAAQAGGVSVRFYDLGTGAPFGATAPPFLTQLGGFAGDGVGSSPTSTANYMWSGNSVIQDTTIAGQGVEPLTGTGFAGPNYLDVTKLNPETLTLTGSSVGDRFLEVYVGSLDSYNDISITLVGGAVYNFPGGASFPNLSLSDVAGGTGKSGMFTFLMPGAIQSVTFSTTANALEIGNVFAAPTPEPATWALMIMGVGLVGGALRLSRKSPDMALAAA